VSGFLTFLIIIAVLIFFGAWVYRLKQQLYSAYLFVQNREREREMTFSFLNRIGEQITTDHDLVKTFEIVLDFCRSATKADAGAIFLKTGQNDEELQATVVQGLFPPLHEVTSDKIFSKRKYLSDFVKKEKLKVGEGIIGYVAKLGKPLLIPNAKEDQRVPEQSHEIVEIEGLILVPLIFEEKVQGVLVLLNKRDESNMAATFDDIDLDLVIAIADQAAVTVNLASLYEQLAEKQRIEQELLVATEFQRLLLPQKNPELESLEIAGYSKPALEVGGDYYDFLQIDEDHLGVMVGDVSGKGIPGALVMATLRSATRAEMRGRHSSRQVLCQVNEIMCQDTKESVFVTAMYAVVNLKNGTINFARAGHEPLICVGANGAKPELKEPNGMVLGMVNNEMFESIEEDEVSAIGYKSIVFYTDGVTEAMNPKGQEYGTDRLDQILINNKENSPQELIDKILSDIEEFTEGIPQHDDITLVVMRWNDK